MKQSNEKGSNKNWIFPNSLSSAEETNIDVLLFGGVIHHPVEFNQLPKWKMLIKNMKTN